MSKIHEQLWKNHKPSVNPEEGVALLEALGGTKLRHQQILRTLSFNIISAVATSFKETLDTLVKTKELDASEGFSVNVLQIAMTTAKELSVDNGPESFILGMCMEQTHRLPQDIASQVMPQIGFIIKGYKEGLEANAFKAVKHVIAELDKAVLEHKEYCEEIFVS